MGVGKVVLGIHGPSRMDHVVGPLHILVAEEEGRIWLM